MSDPLITHNGHSGALGDVGEPATTTGAGRGLDTDPEVVLRHPSQWGALPLHPDLRRPGGKEVHQEGLGQIGGDGGDTDDAGLEGLVRRLLPAVHDVHRFVRFKDFIIIIS